MTSLDDLSTAIGELRSFAAHQAATNAHFLDELTKLVSRMALLAETGVTFVEYRKTLHERFGKLHEQMAEIDELVVDLSERTKTMELAAAVWRGQWTMLLAILYIVSTVTSTLLVNYGAVLAHSLFR